MNEYNIDKHQQDELQKIKKLLKAGELNHVRDTPDYWKLFTKVELDYIINYRRNLNGKKI